MERPSPFYVKPRGDSPFLGDGLYFSFLIRAALSFGIRGERHKRCVGPLLPFPCQRKYCIIS